ncbi:conserved Plasmodium protein, unknown function [Plasmodium malariae]|uniref:HotDog ACOT-type domain-containing protein n=1 Tax=Plasmodium malariae TaxID=5858 RepID=A0A1C3KAF4_PLAMA|nr:conserved Plasmodium protein, unknown function [Plasmodium malariae]
MCTSNKPPLKLENLNKENFQVLREKTLILKKERIYVDIPKKSLHVTSIEKSCPLTFFMLKYKYKIDIQNIQIRVVKDIGELCTNDNEIYDESQIVDASIHYANDANKCSDKKDENFLKSFVQFDIPVLKEFDRVYFFKHIIEIIDTLAADVVYRHSIGGYKKNNKYNFVTVLFNNLKVYEKSKMHHEFCFSLHEQKGLIINCYIVHSGNTSYILKLDFFQENKLIFDIYATFVNINHLTFKPQEVVHVNNLLNNEKYEQVRKFACYIKDIQNMFNHKDIKNKCLHQKDIQFLLNYFKDIKVEEGKSYYYNKNVNNNTNIYDDQPNENSTQENDEKNTLTIIDSMVDTNNLSFYKGKNNFYCKDSYIESKHFISSEFKNIHNFTFGGYLAYLSFCHAMTIIKHFISHPILIEVNEIQYILPVPYNSVFSFRGKVVYCDQDKIQIKIVAYCFDFKKNAYYLTTIFDMSFENNAEIAFIPQSNEEIKLYLFAYIRSQLLP